MTVVLGYACAAGVVLGADRRGVVRGVARATGDDWVRLVGSGAAVAVGGDPRAADAVFRLTGARPVDDPAGDGTPPATSEPPPRASDGTDPDRLTDRVAAALGTRRLDAAALVAAPDDGRVELHRVAADGSVDRVAGATAVVDDGATDGRGTGRDASTRITRLDGLDGLADVDALDALDRETPLEEAAALVAELLAEATTGPVDVVTVTDAAGRYVPGTGSPASTGDPGSATTGSTDEPTTDPIDASTTESPEESTSAPVEGRDVTESED